jgi:SAM-dependent methyltransferase
MSITTAGIEYMAGDYSAYQQRYRSTPRESDLALIRLLRPEIDRLKSVGQTTHLLDIGCHTGNLLYHLKKNFPGLSLVGGDIFEEVLESCRVDPDLRCIEFRLMNVLNLADYGFQFDIIIANAVLHRFSDEEYAQAWESMAKVLRPGGIAVAFDFIHPFRQTIRIEEETDLHPEGLKLVMRGMAKAEKVAGGAGFTEVRFFPFEIGIDLQLESPTDPTHTYTVAAVSGKRMQFRGALFQPWCHMLACKKA